MKGFSAVGLQCFAVLGGVTGNGTEFDSTVPVSVSSTLEMSAGKQENSLKIEARRVI